MKLRAEILAENPIEQFLEQRGIILKRGATNICPTTEHKKGHDCVSVDTAKGVWRCHDCETGGSIIDWVMKSEGIDAGDAMMRLGGNGIAFQEKRDSGHPQRRNGHSSTERGKLIKLYDYTDENGVLLFQVCRFDPKDFRQRRPDGKGGWEWSLGDTRRVLYRLPAIASADFVWIAEGEKDADTLCDMGFVGTCNPLGAKKWEPGYTAALRGKDVAILPDSDQKGAEHRDLLIKELAIATKSIRVIPMPDGFKDITEYADSFSNRKDAALALLDIAGRAEILYRGESVPVQTMEELEAEYKESLNRATQTQLSLASWLPSFRVVRPLVAGTLVSVLAGTGVGKTMILQNIAIHARELHTIFFEIELPSSDTFERFVSLSVDGSGGHVESTYRMGMVPAWRESGRLSHIVCVHQPRLTPDRIRKIIQATELKTCRRPALVLVDYVQLVGGSGESRYERASDTMEQMKILARETNTIVIVASQIQRPSDKAKGREVDLSAGKDSGSIENSSGLVMGAWRDDEDIDRLWLRILKNTKGKSGLTVACRIKDSLRILEETNERDL